MTGAEPQLTVNRNKSGVISGTASLSTTPHNSSFQRLPGPRPPPPTSVRPLLYLNPQTLACPKTQVHAVWKLEHREPRGHHAWATGGLSASELAFSRVLRPGFSPGGWPPLRPLASCPPSPGRTAPRPTPSTPVQGEAAAGAQGALAGPPTSAGPGPPTPGVPAATRPAGSQHAGPRKLPTSHCSLWLGTPPAGPQARCSSSPRGPSCWGTHGPTLTGLRLRQLGYGPGSHGDLLAYSWRCQGPSPSAALQPCALASPGSDWGGSGGPDSPAPD